MKRPVPIVKGEYYHVLGRGNNKQDIFLDERDYVRFLLLILYLQSPISIRNMDRHVTHFVQHRVLHIDEKEIAEIVQGRYVELVNFSLMPNHFHLTLFCKEDGGISQYMQRVLNAFTKYHNTKYEKVGHLFQGPFKAFVVDDDNQLSYLSAYIHRNSREIKEWRNKEHLYPWSSFQDYAGENRWGKLLAHEIITKKFKDGKEYKEFVEHSGAKEDFYI